MLLGMTYHAAGYYFVYDPARHMDTVRLDAVTLEVLTNEEYQTKIRAFYS